VHTQGGSWIKRYPHFSNPHATLSANSRTQGNSSPAAAAAAAAAQTTAAAE